ncbi:MAG: transglutaminase-like cysteine peptidase [Gammaproteobacteria bacterium]|nr:transglutaminase-like cysteine peptidase [Gammaproteobacteria bacterium]
MAARLGAVNDFYNALPWISDTRHWKRKDYWATPLESLLSNGADCEDFAIAKYYALLWLGVDEQRLRLLYADIDGMRDRHMVLAYLAADGDDPEILDNIDRRIRPLSARTDLRPLMAFNTTGAWKGAGASAPRLAGRADNISSWRQMRARLDMQSRMVDSMLAR